MGKIGFWQSGKAAPVDRDNEFDRTPPEHVREFANWPVSGASLNPLEASLILKAYEDSGQGWFWATDKDGRLTYLTTRIAPVLAAQPARLIGTPFADLFLKGDEGFGAGRNLPFMLTRQSKFENIVVRATDSPDTHLWSVSGTPQYDAHGQFAGFRGNGVDITEQRKSSEHTSRLAMYDSLTGLPNRLRAAQVLDAELKRLKIHKRPCAVLMLDLDRFKQVNDTLGHPAGDALLTQVADRLLRIVGDKERIFRLGGDEFQVILRNGDDREAIHELGTRIITSLSQPYSVEGSRCIIGASIGVAVSPAEGCSSDDLIRNADLALYAAKDSGRGCVSFYSSELLQDAEDRRALEDDLRDALAKGEMHVFYQPIVNARTNLTTGVEALVRWHHPDRGSISPAVFIPIAEEANLIGALGEWVLRKACEDAATWPGTMTVAVNVSPMQFANGSLPAIVTSALASAGLTPDRLELEITEGVFLSDGAAADTVFTELKQIGVRLALDDFGTGYSSLGYLRTAPFDKIKIDQSFVRAATLPESRNSAIIAAIVALADALGMETTAEGIESHDQLDLIQRLRVSHVQGFIYSPAIASDELIERLASGEWVISPSGPAQQRSERLSLYRKVRAIFGNHYRYVLIRNLSETGALVEGLDDVPCESHLIIDFGEGHLVFARIVRSRNHQQGIVFEQRLVSDGRGGLLTPNPVSPYTLQKAGLPQLGAADAPQAPPPDNAALMESLRAKLGIAAPDPAESGAEPPAGGRQPAAASPEDETAPTLATLAAQYLDGISDADQRAGDLQLVKKHILPKFGHLRPDDIAPTAITQWLAAERAEQDLAPSALSRLQGIMGQLMGSAQGEPGDSLANWTSQPSRDLHERPLTSDEICQLQEAAEASANPQLKFIVALLILTGVRQRDLLEARWDQLDLEQRIWVIPSPKAGKDRRVQLSQEAMDVIGKLPRWEDCPYLIVNPATHKPYRSFSTSWDTARVKAGLDDVEIDDLRFCNVESYKHSFNMAKEMKTIVKKFTQPNN
ncbi:EAL domain-containing protein [Sphingomonas sp.]|uniref:EAL domain-containing protein n=1 Tax=Sphingomonas sp. TaxID=28214 RepID=UPI00286E5BAC|nr:EAL domain-containing protein [Sphingomonas sp.]